MNTLVTLFQDPRTLLIAVGVALSAVTVLIALSSIIGGFAVRLWIKALVADAINTMKGDIATEMHKIAARRDELSTASVWLATAVLSGRIGRWVRVSVQGEHPDRSNVNTQIGAR